MLPLLALPTVMHMHETTNGIYPHTQSNIPGRSVDIVMINGLPLLAVCLLIPSY